MGDVINLLVPESYDGKVCACGSAWWDARVTFDNQGHVTAYGQPRCKECRSPLPAL